jgi:hypothetical protein
MNPCTLGWYLPLLVQDPVAQSSDRERGHAGPPEQQHKSSREFDNRTHGLSAFAPSKPALSMALSACGSTPLARSGRARSENGEAAGTEAIPSVRDVPEEARKPSRHIHVTAGGASFGEIDGEGEMDGVARGGKGKQRAGQDQTRGEVSFSGKPVYNHNQVESSGADYTAYGDHITTTRDGQVARGDGYDAKAERVNSISVGAAVCGSGGPTTASDTATVASTTTKASAAPSQSASTGTQPTSSSAPAQKPDSARECIFLSITLMLCQKPLHHSFTKRILHQTLTVDHFNLSQGLLLTKPRTSSWTQSSAIPYLSGLMPRASLTEGW